MNMLKHIYKGVIAMALLTVAACSADTFTEALTPGDTPIVLNGTVTRITGSSEIGELKRLTGYTNLKLSAKYGNTFHFKNGNITVDGDGAPNQNKLTTDVRYPAGDQKINLFAHTGSIDDNGNLTLTSGNDILLSNGVNDKEGNGYEGSSKSNVELLTFRHAMTKITIATDFTEDNELQETKPTKIRIKFGNKVPIKGTMPITSKLSDTTTKATYNSKDDGYTLNLEDNYVVPTGERLEGNIITELSIDDYKATANDLKDLEIKSDDASKPFLLAPGLSYTLTLKIKRLKIVGITLKKTDWDIKSGNGDWGYTPYKLAMNFTGGYVNTGEDTRISKVVLKHTTSGGVKYQYVGGVDGNGNIDFVTLPSSVTTPTAELSVDLYTKNGLLVENITPTGYSAPSTGAGSLGISLGANGMNKDVTNTYFEVTTPLQFCNMMRNPGNEKYKLMKNIDMNSLPIAYTPQEWSAELDGSGYSILHLDLNGNGLVTVNNGTLKNIHIGPGTITSTAEYTGGLCGINNGTIEACTNEADIISPDDKTAGGICGKNTKTILACLNTGNIEKGAYIGGICGENNSNDADAMKGCINAGMLNKSATYLGGICGQNVASSNSIIVNTCYWLTGTARPVQQKNNELAIGNDPKQTSAVNSADLAPEKLRDEALTKINTAISSTEWKFTYQKDTNTGTYPCVWPIPSKK